MKTKNLFGGLIFFSILIGLCLVIFDEGFVKGYDLNETFNKIDGTGANVSIGQAMNNLNIMEAMNETSTNILTLQNPDVGLIDLLGGLAGVALGVLKSALALLTLPVEIIGVVIVYYQIPAVLVTGVILLITFAVGFLLIAAYLGRDP